MGIQGVIQDAITKWNPMNIIVVETGTGLKPTEQKLGDMVVGCQVDPRTVNMTVISDTELEFNADKPSTPIKKYFTAAQLSWKPASGATSFVGPITCTGHENIITKIASGFNGNSIAHDSNSYFLYKAASSKQTQWIPVIGTVVVVNTNEVFWH